MTPIQFVLRLFISIVTQPAVQDAVSSAAREVAREASRKLIKEVENGFSRYERTRSTPTVR